MQLIGGLLLLVNRFAALALILLGPIIVNILLFHSLMAPEGPSLALFATGLRGIVFYGFRKAFTGIFAEKAQA